MIAAPSTASISTAPSISAKTRSRSTTTASKRSTPALIYAPPFFPYSRPKPVISSPKPTAPPIPPSAYGSPTTARSIIPTPSTPRRQRQRPAAYLRHQPGREAAYKIDIKRNEHLREAAETQVYSDVDSAFALVNSDINLLKPYKRQYLDQAVRVRDTIFFSYQHGGASLLDFLNAESDYRTVELSYVNLVGAYLTAAAQMNLAVGREVMP